jgi:hypothetical protein
MNRQNLCWQKNILVYILDMPEREPTGSVLAEGCMYLFGIPDMLNMNPQNLY